MTMKYIGLFLASHAVLVLAYHDTGDLSGLSTRELQLPVQIRALEDLEDLISTSSDLQKRKNAEAPSLEAPRFRLGLAAAQQHPGNNGNGPNRPNSPPHNRDTGYTVPVQLATANTPAAEGLQGTELHDSPSQFVSPSRIASAAPRPPNTNNNHQRRSIGDQYSITINLHKRGKRFRTAKEEEEASQAEGSRRSSPPPPPPQNPSITGTSPDMGRMTGFLHGIDLSTIRPAFPHGYESLNDHLDRMEPQIQADVARDAARARRQSAGAGPSSSSSPPPPQHAGSPPPRSAAASGSGRSAFRPASPPSSNGGGGGSGSGASPPARGLLSQHFQALNRGLPVSRSGHVRTSTEPSQNPPPSGRSGPAGSHGANGSSPRSRSPGGLPPPPPPPPLPPGSPPRSRSSSPAAGGRPGSASRNRPRDLDVDN